MTFCRAHKRKHTIVGTDGTLKIWDCPECAANKKAFFDGMTAEEIEGFYSEFFGFDDDELEVVSE